jgi:Protein of unknown function (DUF2752)
MPKSRAFDGNDVLGLVGLLGLLIARFVPVARWVPFWGCGFRSATGFPCPTCGLTRAAERFARGDFSGALAANPLGAVAAFAFALLALATLAHWSFGFRLPEVEWTRGERRWALRVAVMAWLSSWAYVALGSQAAAPGLVG